MVKEYSLKHNLAAPLINLTDYPRFLNKDSKNLTFSIDTPITGHSSNLIFNSKQSM